MGRKFFAALALVACVSMAVLSAQDESSEAAQEQTVAQTSKGGAVKYVAAALAVGVACIGGGLAVGKIGAAAMGAMAENADLSGKALPFVGLAEGICLWGFLVGLLIIIM